MDSFLRRRNPSTDKVAGCRSNTSSSKLQRAGLLRDIPYDHTIYCRTLCRVNQEPAWRWAVPIEREAHSHRFHGSHVYVNQSNFTLYFLIWQHRWQQRKQAVDGGSEIQVRLASLWVNVKIAGYQRSGAEKNPRRESHCLARAARVQKSSR